MFVSNPDDLVFFVDPSPVLIFAKFQTRLITRVAEKVKCMVNECGTQDEGNDDLLVILHSSKARVCVVEQAEWWRQTRNELRNSYVAWPLEHHPTD